MSDARSLEASIHGTLYPHVFPSGHLLVRLILLALAPRQRVTGRGHIPRCGPVILAPNHISDADPPVVAAAVLRPMWFMAKEELFDIPVIGKAISFFHAFPVDRDGVNREAIRRSELLLRQGQGIVIFPEGQCAPDGKMGPVLPGATMLALRSKAPLIPVGIVGSNKIVPYGSVYPRPTLSPLRVHFGEALDFSDLASLPSRAQRQQATLRIEKGIKDALAEAGA